LFKHLNNVIASKDSEELAAIKEIDELNAKLKTLSICVSSADRFDGFEAALLVNSIPLWSDQSILSDLSFIDMWRKNLNMSSWKLSGASPKRK